MTAISCAGRHILRRNARISARASIWRSTAIPLISSSGLRSFHLSRRLAEEEIAVVRNVNVGKLRTEDVPFWKEYKGSYNVPPQTLPFEKQVSSQFIFIRVTTYGFLKKIVKLSESLTFAHIGRGAGSEYIQILSKDPKTTEKLQSIRLNSAVSVTGVTKEKYRPKKQSETKPALEKISEEGKIFLSELEIEIEDITCLNAFDSSIGAGPEHVYQPENRHLQIRFDPYLRNDLLFRSDVAACAREELKDFYEIETPILFKSTPEGAREFLVPTRKPGRAYALPQSPQQYKQILMASGIDKYMQFAKCFRDEDLRADRQPEFTQIDLEMAWTDGEGVMARVEKLIKALYKSFAKPDTRLLPLSDAPFHRMTYNDAMSYHGSDKPDLRIPGLIQRIDHIIPDDLRKMLTDLENPIIEACKIRLNAGTGIVSKTIGKFFSTPDGEEFTKNKDGAPGIAVFDSRRPLEGLKIFGFEGAEKLKNFYSKLPKQAFQDAEDHETATTFDDGDFVFIQARPNLPHSGGSTTLGKLRIAFYKLAVSEGLLEPDPKHHYLWVTDFPLFTPENGVDPGQGGSAGFSATHHPFTAPKTAADVDLLLTDPLKAVADHYDLVVNGVELGGGSRRIHSAQMQSFIMVEVLKMRESRIAQFSHLIRALSAGCPPHAGLAIGFDRLIAVMCGRESVKDVIAFPKSSKGEDMLVKSPRRIWRLEWERYHLKKIDTRRAEHLAAREEEEEEDEEDGGEEGEGEIRSKWWRTWLQRMREDWPFKEKAARPGQ